MLDHTNLPTRDSRDLRKSSSDLDTDFDLGIVVSFYCLGTLFSYVLYLHWWLLWSTTNGKEKVNIIISVSPPTIQDQPSRLEELSHLH